MPMLDNTAGKPHIWSVSEVNRFVKDLLEQAMLPFWLRGEVSNLTIHGSGHVYFSLKDRQGQLSAVFFRGAALARQMELREGMEVEVHGRLTVYEPRGSYQMSVTQLRLCGKGNLQEQFEQLKAKLAVEGLFDPQRKREIPYLPKCIGIVTSPEGAAIRDFLNIIGRRFAGLHLRIVPASVQGKNAAPEIVAGIRWLNAHHACDVIVVTRGGGSMEDLWAFNEEIVARAIAASEIPVISAVGHEVDFTIADFVADLRAPTPSAAAELVAAKRADLLETVRMQYRCLSNAVERRLGEARHRLEVAARHPVFREPAALVRLHQQRVDELDGRLLRAVAANRDGSRNILDRLASRLRSQDPRLRLQLSRRQVDELRRRAEQAAARAQTTGTTRLERLSAQLAALDPTRVLGRGYSILIDPRTGQAVINAAATAPGDPLHAILATGELDATVTAVRPAAEPPGSGGLGV